jgi:hypothetical protein
MTRIGIQALGLAFALLIASASATRGADDVWEPYRFLIGEWVGEGSGASGTGSGHFSFQLDLNDKILVRKNHAEIAASAGRPAAVHEDLLIVYSADGNASAPAKAIYFDNEGHVIRYAISISGDKQTLTFLSEPMPSAPRFRLSYIKNEKDSVTIKFEIAPPGNPDGFKTYLEGKARRRASAKPAGVEVKK